MPATLPPGLQSAHDRRLLACPLCRGLLSAHGRALICPSGHSFDPARQGHVHLAPGHKAPATYDRPLMEARARVVSAGLFDRLLDWCATELSAFAGPAPAVLDAGCGEGSFLSRLAARLPGLVGVGIDLAPEGVRLAAARSKAEAWAVADLAAIPSPDHGFDAILNVLSPANYAEFARVARPGGLLIKAAPTGRHLRELRQALALGEDYSNEPVAEQFRHAVPGWQSVVLESKVPCGPELAADFLAMTPLGWHASEEQRRAFVEQAPEEISVSLEVMWGRFGE